MGTLAVAGQKLTAAFLNQYYAFADSTVTTVTASTSTTLTTSYSIPANEPSVGSAYEIRFGGNGTWGSTQQALQFNVNVGSVSLLGGPITIGAQAFSASATFRFSGLCTIVWDTVGASGKWFPTLIVNLAETANNVAPPATVNQANLQANASYGIGDSNNALSGVTDTTAANAFVVKCSWAATTGAPTITNRITRWAKTA